MESSGGCEVKWRWLKDRSVDHYKRLLERSERHELLWRSMYLDCYRTMVGQTRGLQRQARLIKRLRAEIDGMKQQTQFRYVCTCGWWRFVTDKETLRGHVKCGGCGGVAVMVRPNQ
jgi:glycine/D-amino acid oxidase-like deaminating enzyme